jgi:uncharacterized protein
VTDTARLASGHLAENIMHFARVLRQAGIPVGPGTVLDAIDAAMSGPLRKREDFYWALHSIFVKRHEQHEVFEQAFQLFWRRTAKLEPLLKMIYDQLTVVAPAIKKAGSRRVSEALFEKGAAKPPDGQKPQEVEIDARFMASTQELLRAKDFEQMTLAEQAEARRALAKLRLARLEVRTRRFMSSHGGRRIDLRRSLRLAMNNGGQIIDLARKQRKTREPPLVVLCDISGSCSGYSRMFLHFLHALMNDRDRVHVFLFGTRLTNITRELRRKDIDEAMLKVSAAVKDWSGGTRIGTALHEFNFKWARRVLGQGAHVLLMSDGLDREGLDILATEMQRLRRSARRIVWLNPLLRFDGFEARAGGIRAIMPFVDEFRPVHSLESLQDLAETLASPRRDTHDPRRWMKHG